MEQQEYYIQLARHIRDYNRHKAIWNVLGWIAVGLLFSTVTALCWFLEGGLGL